MNNRQKFPMCIWLLLSERRRKEMNRRKGTTTSKGPGATITARYVHHRVQNKQSSMLIFFVKSLHILCHWPFFTVCNLNPVKSLKLQIFIHYIKGLKKNLSTSKTSNFLKKFHFKITIFEWDPPYNKRIEWQKVDGRIGDGGWKYLKMCLYNIWMVPWAFRLSSKAWNVWVPNHKPSLTHQ